MASELTHPNRSSSPDQGVRKRASSEADKQKYKTPPGGYSTAASQPIATSLPTDSPRNLSSSLDTSIDLSKEMGALEDQASGTMVGCDQVEPAEPHPGAVNGASLPPHALSDGLPVPAELCCPVERAEEIIGTEAPGFGGAGPPEEYPCIPVDRAVAVECDEQVLGELDAAGFEEFSRRIYALNENTSSFRRPRKNSDK